jgi:simple sugar transport system permease protein
VTSERAGVIDLSLEGKLLVAALFAAVGADLSGSVLVGAASGAAAGAAYAGLYGLAVLVLRADQIVAGVAMNLLAVGLTRFLSKLIYGSTANSPPVPGFEGGLLANPVFWLALALPVVLHLALRRTRFGLRLRAVGEHPEAATSLGVSVARVRWAAVLIAGALAGLGGAWLALDIHGFAAEMSGGRGYIALAAVIMGRWRPLAAAAACLLFGFAGALQLQLGAHDVGLPRELTDVLPYLLTMVALCGFIGRSQPPAALGKRD